MIIDNFMTAEAVESELAMRIRAQRLAANITQKELAVRTGLSPRTIANLEQGESVRLDCFIKVLQALGLQGNLEVVVPEVKRRPEDYLQENPQRQRASKREASAKASWKWGDEQ